MEQLHVLVGHPPADGAIPLLVTKKQPVSFCLETKPDGKIQVLASLPQ